MDYVTYLRVSTDRQGESGLGLEAQRKAVNDFIKFNGNKLLAEYVEVESGKRNPAVAAIRLTRPHNSGIRITFANS